MWGRGAQPGNEVKLTLLHGVSMKEVTVHSIDRRDFMRAKPTV